MPLSLKAVDFLAQTAKMGNGDNAVKSLVGLFCLAKQGLQKGNGLLKKGLIFNHTEKGLIMLNVRIATPPPRSPKGTPTGIMSSFIFNQLQKAVEIQWFTTNEQQSKVEF